MNLDCDFVPAIGVAGGLITMWNSSWFSVENVSKEGRILGLVMKMIRSGQSVQVINIYGPNSDTERVDFFNSLKTKVDNWVGPSVVGGDFNSTLNRGERSGLNVEADPTMVNFVNETFLLDLPLEQSNFTWYSDRNGGLWSRIDRWLMNEEAMLLLQGCHQIAENWGLSDHRPILLVVGTVNFGPRPFRFYNSWLLDAEFNDWLKTVGIHYLPGVVWLHRLRLSSLLFNSASSSCSVMFSSKVILLLLSVGSSLRVEDRFLSSMTSTTLII